MYSQNRGFWDLLKQKSCSMVDGNPSIFCGFSAWKSTIWRKFSFYVDEAHIKLASHVIKRNFSKMTGHQKIGYQCLGLDSSINGRNLLSISSPHKCAMWIYFLWRSSFPIVLAPFMWKPSCWHRLKVLPVTYKRDNNVIRNYDLNGYGNKHPMICHDWCLISHWSLQM